MEIYRALGRELPRKAAVKIVTGEPGGHHFLNLALIASLVNSLNGMIVECCTACAGKRMNLADPDRRLESLAF